MLEKDELIIGQGLHAHTFQKAVDGGVYIDGKKITSEEVLKLRNWTVAQCLRRQNQGVFQYDC